jgi:mRNA interferase MazF
MVVQRGEVWWADLPDPTGSEPGFRRPVVVVQADAFNSSRIQTVVVVALTANINRGRSPGNVIIPKVASGLTKDSVANVSNILTVSRSLLTERGRQLPAPAVQAIERGLRLVLDL